MRFSDKIFLVPIILLGFNFIYRLIDFSKIIFTFPLDTTNDLSSYIALIPFLDKYGFLGFVPDWYNGFILFNTYAPGWAFFTYPFYKITSNLLLSTYLSTILLLILGFIGVYLIGKELNLSRIKRIAFYLFIFGNPMLIGAIFKQGRLPSFMALVIFIYIVYLTIYFKDHPINRKILFLSLLYAAIILTHQAETILSGIFLIGLLLIKNNKEKMYIILAILLGILLSSFWLIQFIQSTISTSFLNVGFSNWLTNFQSYFWNNLIGILISISLFILFYFFYKTRQNKQEIILFLPVLILNLLYLTRIVLFIPIIKYIYPDPYIDFFTFFSILFLFSINYGKMSKRLKMILMIGLIVISLASITYNFTNTPFFQDYTEKEENIISLLPLIDQKYIMIIEPSDTSYNRAYYSYAAIYLNKQTISGWGDMYKEYNYTTRLNNLIKDYTKTENCDDLMQLNQEFGAEEILADGHYCDSMVNECKLKIIATEGNACLLSF